MFKKSVLVGLSLIANLFAFSQNSVLETSDNAPDAALQTDIDAANSAYHVKGPEQMSTEKMMWCASSNTLNTGFPAWTHSWAGWMVNITNISTNTITINCFEARFQGTSGYRIYTKTGTFVGFEANAAAWTLVGTAANVTGISTLTSSPIPIGVNVNINPGATQAFYLTRTDNLATTRHLYIAGTGVAGTAVYASDANLQLKEGNYVDVYYILMGGPRRPSMKVYYSIYNPLPIELGEFKCNSEQSGTNLAWTTYSEKNNAYFSIENSVDGINFEEVGRVEGAINSNEKVNYTFKHNYPKRGVNYYRIKQVDVNDASKTFDMITCLFEPKSTKINVYSITGVFLTSITSDDYKADLNKLELTPGMYVLEVNDSENPSFIKYIKP